MNGADKKLIAAWRKVANGGIPLSGIGGGPMFSAERKELADLFAAFDRALADTPPLVEVPSQWCVIHDRSAHHGWLHCPDGRIVWGYEEGTAPTCDLRPLMYVEAKP